MSKNIIIATHTYMGSPFVVGSHHIVKEAEKMGHRIIHLSTPLTMFHILKYSDNNVKKRFEIFLNIILNKEIYKDDKGLNFVPMTLLPWKFAGFLYSKFKVNVMVKLSYPSILKISKIFFSNDVIDLLIIDHPHFVGIEKLIPAKRVIYRPTDIYYKMTRNKNTKIAEKCLCNNVNGIVATSKPVLDEIKNYNPNIKNTIIENGVEYEHFHTNHDIPEVLMKIEGPKAIYVGAIDNRFDINAIIHIANNFPSLNIVLIGPYDKKVKETLVDNSNVVLLGQIEYDHIPQYLSNCDIGLLPLSDHDANRGRSPMKLYEYAASGLFVVSKWTEEIARRNEKFVGTYKDYDELLVVMEKALNQKSMDSESISNSAVRYSWGSQVKKLLEFSDTL